MSDSPLRTVLDHTPADGSLTKITDSLYMLRLSLPFALNHVNAWLLVQDEDACVVDTGLNIPANQQAWSQAFTTFPSAQLRNIFVTHFHPDHVGLAGWLSMQYPAATPHMTAKEEQLARKLCEDDTLGEQQQKYIAAYAQTGLDDTRTAAIFKRMDGYKRAVAPLPGRFHTVKDGDVLTLAGHEWLVIVGFGHSPEHACLYCAQEGLFIAGDMVLPSISPNISLTPRDSDDANPLAAYIDSLKRIKTMVPDSVLVLPSHGLPFYGLNARIDTLIGHHDERCDEIKNIIGSDALHAVAIMEKLFAHRTLDAHTLFFALGETMAHLRYMHGRTMIEAAMDEDNVLLYRVS